MPISLLLLAALALSGCRGLGQTPPPPAYDVNSLATAIAQTESAPLPGYEAVAFPQVDAGLDALPGFHYTVEMRFEGTYSQTTRETEGYIRAEVWWDEVGQARRVKLDAEGDSFVQEPRHVEAVRLDADYYLVDDEGRCLANVEETARAISSLDAGSLIGGVTHAPYSGTHAVLNGIQAYRFDVTPQNTMVPAIHLIEDSALDLTGELWIAPEHDVVVRFYANLDATTVRLFESQLPVSGQVFIRYDVFDLGVVPNISIPFGC